MGLLIHGASEVTLTLSHSLQERGGGSFTRGMRGFPNFINRNQLIDYLLIGGKFTWSNRGKGGDEQIDRFFVSVDWENLFPHHCS